MIKFVLYRVEKIVEKGENALAPLPQLSSKAFFLLEGCSKLGLCGTGIICSLQSL